MGDILIRVVREDVLEKDTPEQSPEAGEGVSLG